MINNQSVLTHVYDWNSQVLQDDDLQNVINTSKHEDNSFDNILDIIFKYYEDFLNDETGYQSAESDFKNDSNCAFGPPESNTISSSLSTNTTEESYFPSVEKIVLSKPVSSKSNNNKNKIQSHDDNNNGSSSNNKKQKVNDHHLSNEHGRGHGHVSTAIKIKKGSKILLNEMNNEKQQRLDYLMTIPKLIGQAVNLVNKEQLQEIVESAFLPNCAVRTNALRDDIIGRENVVAIYEAIFRMIPDFVMNVIPPTMNNRVITAKIFSSGTLCKNDDPSDRLFNHLKHRQDDESFIDARELHTSLKQQGKQMEFKSKSLMHLILNEDMTYVERYVATSKTAMVSEAKFAFSSSSSSSSSSISK